MFLFRFVSDTGDLATDYWPTHMSTKTTSLHQGTWELGQRPHFFSLSGKKLLFFFAI